MRQQFEIKGRLDGLNEYTSACRSHRQSGARMKRENQDVVLWAIKSAHLKPYDGMVSIRYEFYDKPKRNGARMRDKSNIASFAVKVIEDALQEAGIIGNDDWDHIGGYSCDFYRASGEPRIVVTIDDEKGKQ